MPERPLGPADWLRKTVTDFDKQTAPKVEEVKTEVVEQLDPAVPKVEETVKVEDKAVPVPPVAEVVPVDTTTPTSTVPPSIVSPAPTIVNTPQAPASAAQPPTSPLK